MVMNRSLGQSPFLLLEDDLFLIALRLKGLINDVIENQTQICVKVFLVIHDVMPLVLAISVFLESILCILQRLVLPVVSDASHTDSWGSE